MTRHQHSRSLGAIASALSWGALVGLAAPATAQDFYAGKTLNIIAAHPVPPHTTSLTQERDRHIAMLSAHTHEPFLLAGDFNVTPWSPGFNGIPGRRIGAYLFAPTWFSNLPLLGLPIDHIMVSPALKASAYRVAPSTGSDHRALLARVHP